MWIVLVNDCDTEGCDNKPFGPWNTKEEAMEWAKGRANKNMELEIEANPAIKDEMTIVDDDNWVSVQGRGTNHDYLVLEVRSPDQAEEWI